MDTFGNIKEETSLWSMEWVCWYVPWVTFCVLTRQSFTSQARQRTLRMGLLKYLTSDIMFTIFSIIDFIFLSQYFLRKILYSEFIELLPKVWVRVLFISLASFVDLASRLSRWYARTSSIINDMQNEECFEVSFCNTKFAHNKVCILSHVNSYYFLIDFFTLAWHLKVFPI